MRAPVKLGREEAETIAIRVAGALAGRPELMRRFLDLAGLAVGDLTARLAEPALLGALLDFVLFDEALTVELAAAADVPPEMLAVARRRLPGAPVEG